MSVQNGERLVTKQDLADFYNDIRPYMGGLVSSKAGFTPIGTIISVMGTTAPTNYLACDGTVYNITDYTELANYFNDQFGSKNYFGGDGTTTFAVPDLRGEFLRGTGTNSHSGQGSGANVGVHQDATNIPAISSDSGGNVIYQARPVAAINADVSINTGTEQVRANASRLTGLSGQGVAYTSRPTNTSVLYCIATKNFYIDPTLDYSTEEKIVGTWIDGKPLYQKTFTGLSLNFSGQNTAHISMDTSSIGALIGATVIRINDSPFIDNCSAQKISNSAIALRAHANWENVNNVVLQYIKTTT